MEGLFNILYFLVTSDPNYDFGRPFLLGQDGAESSIFTNTLLLSLLAMLLLSVLFYLVINRTLMMNKLWMWFIFLFLGGLICFQISLASIGGETGLYPPSEYALSDMPALGWKFIGLSIFWGMFYFYLFSIILNRWSVNAKYCPHQGLFRG